MRTSTLPGQPKKGEETLGRSRSEPTTKIHAGDEGFGQLARFTLPGGQVHDVTQALAFRDHVEPAAVLAEKDYDSHPLLGDITSKKA